MLTNVDFEVATDYTMVIEVVDTQKTPEQTGQVTLKVCFIFIFNESNGLF